MIPKKKHSDDVLLFTEIIVILFLFEEHVVSDCLVDWPSYFWLFIFFCLGAWFCRSLPNSCRRLFHIILFLLVASHLPIKEVPCWRL